MTVTLAAYRDALRGARLTCAIGQVRRVTGMTVEVEGLHASVGDVCAVQARPGEHVDAEVVAVREDGLLLMPYGAVRGLGAGCKVTREGERSTIAAGDQLLGRVIDCFGMPLDGGPPLRTVHRASLQATPINPMQRPRIDRALETGVRAIDGLLTLGLGQRTGIFAGSGVGKSTLLGMIARHVAADVNVIALIGERGREVREFIDKQLGSHGLARSVVVVATSDQPALCRVRATHAALAIAGQFRDAGLQVLLTLDSVTRFAMAQREIGLSAGEPPTARGYTPSVFARLPELCERCGTAPSGGSITALMTVLVEGDDFNEPIADSMRSILDGHIVLSRRLAHAGHYPAIDVLQSASRVMPDITPAEHRDAAAAAVSQLALLERYRQLVDIGAYESGTNPGLDHALSLSPRLDAWLRQREGGARAADAVAALQDLMKPHGTAVPTGAPA